MSPLADALRGTALDGPAREQEARARNTADSVRLGRPSVVILERIVGMEELMGASEPYYWAERLDRADAERLLDGQPNCMRWLPIYLFIEIYLSSIRSFFISNELSSSLQID